MIRFFKEYFYFTRGERNGTFVLVTIMILVFVFPGLYNRLRNPVNYQPDPEFLSEVRAFYGLQESDGSRKIPVADTGTRHQPGVWIDINSADTTELMRVRGIGPVLSRRILRYRNILGGYVRLSQLEEVYGLDQERFLEIEPFLYADSTRVIKLRLLSDEFGTLLRHPYLNYEQVSTIFRLRNVGRLNSPEDLSASGVFTDDDMHRLVHYLAFE